MEVPRLKTSNAFVSKQQCGCGGTGRRAGLRSLWGNTRGGSSPLIRTKDSIPVYLIPFYLFAASVEGLVRASRKNSAFAWRRVRRGAVRHKSVWARWIDRTQ